MCTSKSEGGKRCSCDSSEARRLRRHNKAALDRNVQESSEVKKLADYTKPVDVTYPHSPFTLRPLTKASVHQIAAEMKGLKQDFLAETEPEKIEDLLKQMNDKALEAGGIVSALIAAKTGNTDVSYVAKKQLPVAKAQEYLDFRQQQLKEETEILKEAEENRGLSAEHEEIYQSRKRDWNYRESNAIIAEEELKIAKKNLSDKAQVFAKERGHQALSVIQEIRATGGSIPIKGGHQEAIEHLRNVEQFIPTDWIDKTKTLPELFVSNKPAPNSEEKASGGSVFGYHLHSLVDPKVTDRVRRKQLNKDFNVQLKRTQKPADYAQIVLLDLNLVIRAPKDNLYERVDSTALHEFIHRVQVADSNLLAKMDNRLLVERTTTNGERDSPVKITDKNVYYPDTFARSETGRFYSVAGGCEITTTAAQAVFFGEEEGYLGFTDLQRKDPHLRDYLLGIWATL